MDPKRRSIPEAVADRTLGVLVDDLRKAERILTSLQRAGSSPNAPRI
jgi:hypothetical protein